MSRIRENANNLDRELLTPGQYPIMAAVEGTERLDVAAGGSFHGFKFLTAIGQMFVKNMDGKIEKGSLEERLMQQMGWDKKEGAVPLHPDVVPP